VNIFYHIFICSHCHQAIPSHMLAKHLYDHHNPQEFTTLQTTTFKWFIEESSVKWEIPYPQPSLKPPAPRSCPIEGLKVYEEGWQCERCPYACLKESSIRRHIGDSHPHVPRHLSKALYQPAKVQRLSSSPHGGFFSVDPNLFPIAAGDPYSVYVSDNVLPQPEVSPPSISRDIPLLLRETEWHVHFAAQLADPSLRENTRALFTSAKNPGAGPLLNRAVKDWFSKAYRHIKSQDVIVRRLLSKEGQPPFNPLTESKSITNYLSYAITFLSLCIRAITHPSHTYPIPLSPEQLASVQALVDSLAAGAQPSHQQVQKALWHLLCSHPPDIHTDKWRSPLSGRSSLILRMVFLQPHVPLRSWLGLPTLYAPLSTRKCI
jgi:hypothetical protein